MANEAQVDVFLNFVTKQARRASQKVSQTFTRSFGAIRGAARRANGMITGIIGSLASMRSIAMVAGTALLGALGGSQIIQAANAEEDAIRGLTSSLQIMGDATKENLNDIKEFANEVQRTSTVGNETAIKMVDFAMTFQLTADQAKEATRAAIDYSAATGQDLQGSVQRIARTYGGMAGELGEVNSEVRDLTRAQLEAGGAVDVISKQFEGQASKRLRTFSGAWGQLQNAMGDVVERVGEWITKNPVIIDGIKNLTAWFSDLSDEMANNTGSVIQDINNSFQDFVGFVQDAITPVQFMVRVVSSLAQGFVLSAESALSLVSALTRLDPFAEFFRLLTQHILRAAFGLVELRRALANAGDWVEEVLGIGPANNAERIADQADRIQTALAGTANEVENVDFDRMADSIGAARDGASKIREQIALMGESANESLDGFREDLGKADKTIEQMMRKWTMPELEVSSSGGGGGQGDGGSGAFDRFLKSMAGQAEAATSMTANLAKNVSTAVTSGAEGAKNMVVAAGSSAVEAFAPGFGAAAKPIINALAQGPDKIREMIRGFTDALPEIITTIVKAIPVLITELVRAVPKLIDKLIDELPRMIEGFVERLPELFEAIAKAAPKLIMPFTMALIENLPDIIRGFIRAFIQAVPELITSFINQFVTGIPRIIQGFVRGIPQIVSGIARGAWKAITSLVDNITGGVGDFLGFAQGGQVPAGFPNDSFPASLTSGEYVIDRNLSSRLDSFLSGNGGSSGGRQDAMLGAILQELKRPQRVDTRFELEDRGFARAMLRMDKLGKRTSER